VLDGASVWTNIAQAVGVLAVGDKTLFSAFFPFAGL